MIDLIQIIFGEVGILSMATVAILYFLIKTKG